MTGIELPSNPVGVSLLVEEAVTAHDSGIMTINVVYTVAELVASVSAKEFPTLSNCLETENTIRIHRPTCSHLTWG